MRKDKEKNIINLIKNDKYVLKQLIEHGHISDTSTAKKLGITPQAVTLGSRGMLCAISYQELENNGI